MPNAGLFVPNHFSLLRSPHERRSHGAATNGTARDAARRVGARLRQHVHGYLVGDDPRPAAGVFDFRARRQRRDCRRSSKALAKATASISKLFSGWLSDKLGKRKALTIVGYGLGALSKPLFALAPTASLVLARAVLGPHRQRHPRRAPRRSGGRHGAGGHARRGLRPAAGARYGGRLCRTVARHRTDGPLHDNFRLIFWIALDPRLDVRSGSRLGRARTAAPSRRHRSASQIQRP